MNILITGASRGLGDAFSRGLGQPGDTLWLVSRNPCASLQLQDGVTRHWIEADLSSPGVHQQIASRLGADLDVLIHNAGIWETGAFSSDYRFENVSEAETRNVLEVNLIAPILLTQALLPKLRTSSNPKIILIGSINGLENTAMPEVAYSASKFGLRGLAHALREHLRHERIAVTVVNPGSIAWEAALSRDDLIPPTDIVRLVRAVLETSGRTVVKEIDLPAMQDRQV
jgi:NAD(P)-dependent dehydrogenase (short-subunit alcohol dehydrogenase family)